MKDEAPVRWTDVTELTSELFRGRVELGNLESLVQHIGIYAKDVEGRQIGEGGVSPARFRDNALTRWVICPYSGSRHQDPHPMNVSALAQITSNWPQIVRLISTLQSDFVRRLGRPGPAMTLADVYVFAIICTALPDYLLCRPDRPLRNEMIPVALAGITKTMGGIQRGSLDMMVRGQAHGYDPDSVITTEQFIDHVEENALLQSPTESCAAPPDLLRQVVSTVINGGRSEPEALREIIGDVDRCFAYCVAKVKLRAWWGLFQSRTGELCRHLLGALPKVEASTSSFSAVEYLNGAHIADRLDRMLRVTIRNVGPLTIETPEQRQAFERALVGIAERCCSLQQLDAAVTPAFHVERPGQDECRAVLQLLASGGMAPLNLPEDLQGMMVEMLLQCLAMEREALVRFSEEQRRINVILDRPEAEPLGGEDLRRALALADRVPLSWIIADCLRLDVENRSAPERVVALRWDHAMNASFS